MKPKILKETLKTADDGRVEYTVLADNRLYHGIIEQSFFEDVLGQSNASTRQKMEITTHNLMYLEEITQRQLEAGESEVIIR